MEMTEHVRKQKIILERDSPQSLTLCMCNRKVAKIPLPDPSLPEHVHTLHPWALTLVSSSPAELQGTNKTPRTPPLWGRRELANGKGVRPNFLLHGVSQEQVLKSSRLCWHEQNDGALSTISAQCCSGGQNKPLLQSVTCAGADYMKRGSFRVFSASF